MAQFRKSTKIGPFRLTASKRGLGVSAGAGPIRVSRGADGKTRRTLRVPGTGIYDTKVIGGNRKSRRGPAPSVVQPVTPVAKSKEPGTGTAVLGIVVFGGGGLWLLLWAIGAGEWLGIVVGAAVTLFVLFGIAGLILEFRTESAKGRLIQSSASPSLGGLPESKTLYSPVPSQAAVSNALPRGWYPDHMQIGRERYWSGAAWTSQTRWPQT